jgi:methyl-accepting chemotaxis protein
VRNPTQRGAASAKKIKQLNLRSVECEQVDAGSKLVEQAGSTMGGGGANIH